MMFLKFLCCKETLAAQVTTGEIKSVYHYPTPMLEIHVSVSMGGVHSQADFLYLQP
jgi:hypothetical protein